MSGVGWGWRCLLVEAYRRLRGAPTRTASLAIAACVGAAALVLAETSSVGGAMRFRAESRSAGSGVAIVEAPAAIDAERCATIASHTGVVGSGALANRAAVALRTAPGVLVQTVDITGGLLRVWTGEVGGNDLSNAGWIVGESLSSELGLNRGSTVRVEGGSDSTVGAVMPRGVRTSRPDRWLVSVVPPAGLMDECWVEFGSQVGAGELEYLTSAFADVDEAATRPLLRPNALSRDTGQEVRERLSSRGWMAFVVLIGLLHLVAWRARRRERALYTVLGTSRLEHFLMAQTEVLLVAVIPACAGALAVAMRWLLVEDVLLTGSQPLRVALANLSVGVICCLIVVPLLAVPLRIDRLYQELRSE